MPIKYRLVDSNGVVLAFGVSIGDMKGIVGDFRPGRYTVDEISGEVNRILESHHRLMQNVSSAVTTQHVRLQFDVEGCTSDQKDVLRQLRASAIFSSVTPLGRVERE